MVLLLSGCSLFENDNIPSKSDNNKIEGDIIQIKIDTTHVTMLDSNNDLYVYGSDYLIGINELNKPKKLIGNVKYFEDDKRLVIVDNDDKAYYIGIDKSGKGTAKEFDLIFDGVKDIKANYFCFYIIDKDNDLRFKIPDKNSESVRFCSLPSEFKGDLSKEINGVKDITSTVNFFGYVNSKNEFYASYIERTEFVKVLSNVSYVVDDKILTNNGDIYNIYITNNEKLPSAKLIRSNVIELYSGNFYKLKTGEFYYGDQMLKYDDIKVPYFIKKDKFAYLNKSNKITLASDEGSEELELSIDSMKKIYEFFN